MTESDEPLGDRSTARSGRSHPFDVDHLRRWPRAPYVVRGLPFRHLVGQGVVRSLRSDGAVTSSDVRSLHPSVHVLDDVKDRVGKGR